MSKPTSSIISRIQLGILTLAAALIPWLAIPGSADIANATKLLVLALCAGSLLVASLVSVAMSEKVSMVRSVFDWIFLGLLLTIGLSTLLSQDFQRSVWGIGDEATLSLVLMLSLFVLTWYVFQLATTLKAWWQLVYGLLAGSAVVAVGSLDSSLVAVRATSLMLGTGMYLALSTLFSFGLALSSRRTHATSLVLYVVGVIGLYAVVRLGLFIPTALLAIGSGVLVMLGLLFVRQSSTARNAATLLVFIIALVSAFAPSLFQQPTQNPDIILGASSSWQITQALYQDGIGSVLIGTGPGTFLNAFTMYRPASFNADPFTASLRFAWPQSTFIAMLVEFGVLATLVFFLLLFTLFGIMLTSWRKNASLFARIKERVNGHSHDLSALDVFVCSLVLVLATVGFFFSYAEYAYWLLWCFLFGLTVVVSSGFIPTLFTTQSLNVRTSSQLQPARIFVLVIAMAVVIIGDVYVTRVYLADRAYVVAVQGPQSEAKQALEEARSLYAGDFRSALALSYVHLGEAQAFGNVSEPTEATVTAAAASLQDAVSLLRSQVDIQPKHAVLWQALSELYGLSKIFTPEATEWELSSLRQAIALDPVNAVLHLQLGQALESAERTREAKEAYRAAYQLQPTLHRASVRLATLLEAEERYDDAIDVFANRIELLGNEPDLLTFIGRLYYNRGTEGDLAVAEQLWQRAIFVNPDLVDAHYALQVLYDRVNLPDQAAVHAAALERLTP